MLYVSEKQKNNYGVVDTDDGSMEFYEKETLLNIVKRYNIEIDGVDIKDGYVIPVVTENETLDLLQQNNIHLALSTMTLQGTWFCLRLSSKPTKGEMHFVSNAVLNISRTGVNRFSIDIGSSKSYRSDMTLDDVLASIWSKYYIKECKKGRH